MFFFGFLLFFVKRFHICIQIKLISFIFYDKKEDTDIWTKKDKKKQ